MKYRAFWVGRPVATDIGHGCDGNCGSELGAAGPTECQGLHHRDCHRSSTDGVVVVADESHLDLYRWSA